MLKPEFIAGSEKDFIKFISNLNEKDKVAIISHTDQDGLISGIIMSRLIGKPEIIKFIDYEKKAIEKIIKQISEKKINKVIITDICLNIEEDYIKQIEKFAEILIIDHHVFSKDLNSNKTTFLATHSEIPASYSCYYLTSKYIKIPSWLVAIALISDKADKYNEKNSIEVFDDFHISGKKQIWDKTISLGRALIGLDKKIKIAYDILINSKNIDDLKKLEKYAKPVEKEIEKYLKEYKEKKQEYKDLIIFEFEKNKFNIKGILINKISNINKDKTYVFLTKEDSLIKVSTRRQDKKINCVNLLKKSIKNIPNSTSGGHPGAAGARFPIQYKNQFKQNLISVLNS